MTVKLLNSYILSVVVSLKHGIHTVFKVANKWFDIICSLVVDDNLFISYSMYTFIQYTAIIIITSYMNNCFCYCTMLKKRKEVYVSFSYVST